MNNNIKNLLEYVINAPSGSNSQPWRFEVKGNQVDVIALPEKDHPILNFQNRGTWIAHGALIENIAIAAPAFGYRADIKIFPDLNERNLTARITLEKITLYEDELYTAIPLRTTNRKPYEKIALTSEQKQKLFKSESEVKEGRLLFVDGEEKLSVLGHAMSMNEVVMLEDKALHKLFFDEIVWTKIDEEKRKSGLYLKTMELKPPQEKALKLFKYWPVMNVLNKLGLAKKIASDNARVYASAGAIGIITVEDTDEAFLRAGRLMERGWLKATKMGLSFHLMTGVLFLWQRIQTGVDEEFSETHRMLIKDSYKKIAEIFNVKNSIIAVAFRIGKDGEPSATSTKMPPQINFL